MFAWIKYRLKYALAGKELQELDRRRILVLQYHHWFSEFPDIVKVIENQEATLGTLSVFHESDIPHNPDFKQISNILTTVRRMRAEYCRNMFKINYTHLTEN
jgi:hypothetical protein